LNKFILYLKKRDGGFQVLSIVGDKLRIDKNEYELNSIKSLEGAITDHIAISEYSDETVVSKILPIGYIKFNLSDGIEIEVETVNPLAKLEELVIWLNMYYRRSGLPDLRIVYSSGERIAYSR